jgi:hypothetical protein
MGQGVEEGGKSNDRLAEVAAEGTQSLLAKATDRGAYLFMDRAEQEDELRDYEKLCETSEAFILVAMSRLRTKRLAHA